MKCLTWFLVITLLVSYFTAYTLYMCAENFRFYLGMGISRAIKNYDLGIHGIHYQNLIIV